MSFALPFRARPLRGLSLGLISICACAALVGGASRPLVQDEPDLETLAWMSGHWRQETERGATEELWMAPRGGLMLGLNRTVCSGKRTQFEYLRIEQSERGVVLLASPGGRHPPTAFALSEADLHHALFENPEHDFPKRIEYRRAADQLVVSIAGDTPGPSWTFARVNESD